MRFSSPPWPSAVPDRVLVAVAVVGTLVFLGLAAGNPIEPDHLIRLQLAFTPERWSAVFADGATIDAVRSHLVRDVAGMIPGYLLSLTALFSLLWRRAGEAGQSRVSRQVLLRSAWLPIVFALVDMVENAGMWSATGSTDPSAAVVGLLSAAAAVKWSLVLVTLLGPLLSLLRASTRG